MVSKLIILSVVLLILVALCDAKYQGGLGKYESYNGVRNAEEETNKRFFLGTNRNRPPSHDTPASSCSCSKYMLTLKRVSKIKIWIIWHICIWNFSFFLFNLRNTVRMALLWVIDREESHNFNVSDWNFQFLDFLNLKLWLTSAQIWFQSDIEAKSHV